MLNLNTLLRPIGVSLALGALAPATMAGISSDSNDFELVLFVVDQTNAKLSYTLDLGIKASEFWVQAQQDTGASLFRTLDPLTDPAFKTFIDAATPSTTRWMVAAFGRNDVEGSRSLFSTLTNNNVVATQTQSFDRMKSLGSGDMVANLPPFSDFTGRLNSAGPAQIKQSTHNSAANGSSVASKDDGNTTTYMSRGNGFGDTALGDGTCMVAYLVCAGNPVGVSSWFYKLTPVLTTPGTPQDGVEGDPVIVDEFDNLTADGFWGFAKNTTTGKYILSYTLTGSNPKSLVSTDAGRNRLSAIDYSAQSGSARQISFAADDVANLVTENAWASAATATAVPEPASWHFALLGLLGVGAAARRKTARAQRNG